MSEFASSLSGSTTLLTMAPLRRRSQNTSFEEEVLLADRLSALSKMTSIEEYIVDWKRGLEAE